MYIVLELVGSARLKFGDDRYYEFLCFDVPKVFRCPGYDHGHDEESQNGRDVKIDILGDYVRTPEWFWKVLDIYWSTGGGYRNPPGGLLGLMGPSGEEEGRPVQAAPPPPLVRIGQGGGAVPPFPSLALSHPPPLLLQLGKEGVLLLVG